MEDNPFIGREKELQYLQQHLARGRSSLVVIKGRRRIGKSRLVTEFAAKSKGARLWNFSGLAPEIAVDAQSQRDHFSMQLVAHLQIPPPIFKDWTEAFYYLSKHVQKGDIVLFDEISWMGSHDPTFIPKLKDWWDKLHTAFMLILCGSVSIWIEENILNSTALFGRINLILILMPLTIPESMELMQAAGFKGSEYNAYKLLSIFGGVPWYLGQVTLGMSADEIIKELCFKKGGVLVVEFDHIFHDLFNGHGSVYRKILDALQGGAKTLAEIRDFIDFAYSGTLSQLMENLITAGFVQKRRLWAFATGKAKKQSLYRICDPYIRFYFKMIAPLRNKIDMGSLDDIPLSSIPGIDAHMGLQLEYLLLQNRKILLERVGISPIDVVNDGPYRQSHTSRYKGCQIDYLVQTVTKNIFIYEFKFVRGDLDFEIITAMQNKIAALKVPKGYAVVPVLFYMGWMTPAIASAGYFYRTIDIADFLNIYSS
ncbi:MAG: ATP-binding protein [Proteobacteria bacterium]|nr:ATP-binding protein [Pseudomonadota bacterium]